MSMRDANRGGCSQSCRWKYDLYDMPFGRERKSLKEKFLKEFSMSAVDMSMIDHIPDMIENGVDSLRLRGVWSLSLCFNSNKLLQGNDATLKVPEKFDVSKTWLMKCGRLPNVSWLQVSTLRNTIWKWTTVPELVVRFQNTSLLLK